MLTVRVAAALDASLPVIRPVSTPTEHFDAAPDSAALVGDVVFTTLGKDAESAGALGVMPLLRRARVAIDARGFPAGVAAGLAAGACLRAWSYEHLRTRAREDAPLLEAIDLVCDDAHTSQVWAATSAGVEAAMFARDLVAEPSNTLTPAGFVERLGVLAAAGVAVEVIEADALRARGFGGLLAVGGGSVHAPLLVVLRWAGEGAPVAFVGKGITFDTGGISIKPADRMWEMRADMAGAAACAGAMLALARRGSTAAAMAVLPLAENATGAASYRPGDVLRMFDGSTVAVVDTDAEGRLVLADALAYAVTQRPRAIIDLATLTGSIVAALGHHMAGAFGTNAALLAAAQAAGEAVGERVWPMPLAEAYRRALDSDIADIRHCVDGSGHPDACQAAAFLREFVGEIPWLHLDIAGVESHAEASERHAAGPTGFGVRLLDRLVGEHYESHG